MNSSSSYYSDGELSVKEHVNLRAQRCRTAQSECVHDSFILYAEMEVTEKPLEKLEHLCTFRKGNSRNGHMNLDLK